MSRSNKGRIDLDDVVEDLPVSPDNEGEAGQPDLTDSTERASTLRGLRRGQEAGTKIAGRLVEADTNKCRMWSFADRLDEGLSEPELADLARSIKDHGQRVPVIARKLDVPEDGVEFEIIAGKRRFEACKRAGVRILMMVKDLSDAEAFAVMLVENDDREDISAFSRALSLSDALERGIYDSQADLINQHNENSAYRRYNKSQVSKMLSAAKLRDYEWLWQEVRQPSTVGVKPCYLLIKHLEGEKSHAVENLLRQKLAALRSAGRLGKLTGGQLINELLAATEKMLAPQEDPRRPITVQSGDIQVSAHKSKKGLIFEVTGDISRVSEDDVLTMLKTVIGKLQ